MIHHMQMRTFMRNFLLSAMFLLSGLSVIPGLAAPAQAGSLQDGILMEAVPAYQGYFKYGEWLPVWVTLENAGADVEGEIQVQVSGDANQITYAVPVSLPRGARKSLPVYVQPNNYTHELRVVLNADGQALAVQTVNTNPQPNNTYMIGVISPERAALSILSGVQLPSGRKPRLIDLTLSEIPDRGETLRSLDVIILNNTDTSQLTPKQQQALTGWVLQGGRLVVGGGTGAFQTAAGLPDELVVVSPETLVELDSVDELAEFAQGAPILVPGPFLAAEGTVFAGSTLAAADNLPLIQDAVMGDGYATYVALDLAASPFNAWAGNMLFWEELLAPGADYPSWLPPDASSSQIASGSISSALANIPNLELPSARTLGVLLIVYILLVGPLNYLLLRWQRKLHLAWLTIPLITIVFSALSFGIGYAKRGSDLLINKIAIIQAGSPGYAQVSSYLGLFSPANASYEIEVAGDYLLSPLTSYYDPWSAMTNLGGNLTFVQGSPSLVRGLSVDQWSMQSFAMESTRTDIGGIIGELTIKQDQLEGTLTNETRYLLQDAILILGSDFMTLGDLEPGAVTPVAAPFGRDLLATTQGAPMSWRIFESEYAGASGPPSREIEFKRMVLEAVLDQPYRTPVVQSGQPSSSPGIGDAGMITLLGWVDGAPPDILVNGQVHQENGNTLYITQLPYGLPESGKITVPFSLVPGSIIDMPMNAGPCGNTGTSVWFETGDVVFEFRTPPGLADFKIQDLELTLHADGPWNTLPQVALYHWETSTWEVINEPVQGVNQIGSPGAAINPDGAVRVRLSKDGAVGAGSGYCTYLGISFEGVR